MASRRRFSTSASLAFLLFSIEESFQLALHRREPERRYVTIILFRYMSEVKLISEGKLGTPSFFVKYEKVRGGELIA